MRGCDGRGFRGRSRRRGNFFEVGFVVGGDRVDRVEHADLHNRDRPQNFRGIGERRGGFERDLVPFDHRVGGVRATGSERDGECDTGDGERDAAWVERSNGTDGEVLMLSGSGVHAPPLPERGGGRCGQRSNDCAERASRNRRPVRRARVLRSPPKWRERTPPETRGASMRTSSGMRGRSARRFQSRIPASRR